MECIGDIDIWANFSPSRLFDSPNRQIALLVRGSIFLFLVDGVVPDWHLYGAI
jgi:hypothetical protein